MEKTYTMHYTTKKGFHHAKDFDSLEELTKVSAKYKVWAVTEWHVEDGVHKGVALSYFPENF